MNRRDLLAWATALAAAPLARPHAQTPVTVRWWYHFDDPSASPAELVRAFEASNPGIHVQAENIPWGGGSDYDTRMYSAIIANDAPDCAMVKFNNMPRLMEMDAIEPLDGRIAAWPGRADISDYLWALHRASDGHRYYLPVQYVVLYLYVRQDWVQKAGLPMPTDFDKFLAAAKAMTGDDRWGFGLRGGAGGHDFWCSFVLGGGAKMVKGGLVTPEALAANKWFIDLFRVQHVEPPSAPSDGFLQIISNLKAGRTGMTIHHIGSANEISAALGDAITAMPVPRGPQGKGWTSFGDGSNAIFAQGRNKDAAWAWISYLSTGETNVAFNKLSGQVTVTSSGARNWSFQPKRFIDATVASLPIAATLPPSPQTADFTRTVWPQTTQKALLGQISPDDMMRTFETLYFG
ncbi:MAG TPA: sugar ABC transporter substrate-binding protein [Acetobacteraceae bacterium]|jgi:multiple sugar transport system substrate-binding protein|nr:sugar ABC transporter substrate-binding protein [Acetobacteraceae bacterium]